MKKCIELNPLVQNLNFNEENESRVIRNSRVAQKLLSGYKFWACLI